MEQGQSLADAAHQRLRSDIVEGRIRPNSRLIAAELAEQLKISRTPIREALGLLALEGLVMPAKRGYVVREHTAREIREIYEVRAALEGMAARLAAERATDEQLQSLKAIGAHDRTVIDDDRQVIVDLNGEFHATIVAIAGNERLADLNRRNSEHFFNYRIADLYTDVEATEAVNEHSRILEALISRDPDLAEVEARDHVLEALRVTLTKLRR